jgi:hypothetical protein
LEIIILAQNENNNSSDVLYQLSKNDPSNQIKIEFRINYNIIMELIIKPNWSSDQWEIINGTFSVYQNVSGNEITIWSSIDIPINEILRVRQSNTDWVGKVYDKYPTGNRWVIFIKIYYGISDLSNIVSVQKQVDFTVNELDGEFSIDLNIRIFDLKELKRSSAFSKTIDIPFSENNNLIFSQIYNVNIDTGFNPKKKCDALITDGGILLLSGYLQIQDIDLPNKIYKCVFFGDNKNLFDDIGDKFIFGNRNWNDDLDLNFLIHNKYQSEMMDSWNGNRDWVYGLISTETDIYTLEYMTGQGIHTQGVEPKRWKVYIRAKAILDAIFKKWGWEYESDFLNSKIFKNLTILPNLLDAPGSDVVKWSIGNPPSYSYNINRSTPSNTIYNNLPFTTLVHDPFSSYNPVTWEFVIPYDGAFSVNMMLNFNSQVSQLISPNNAEKKLDNLTIVPVVYRRGVEIWRNENWFKQSGSLKPIFSNISGVIGYIINSQSRLQIKEAPLGINLKSGDVLKFYAKLSPDSYFSALTVTGKKVQNVVPNKADLFPDDEVNFISLLGDKDLVNPAPLFNKIKQADFIGDIVKMFNLYIKPDKYNPRKFLIEPRDDFYKKGKVVDFLDYDRDDVNINYLIDIAAKKYKFTYSSGDDDANKQFTSLTRGRIFGDALIESENDCFKNEKIIELKAVPTIIRPAHSSNNIFLPSIENGSKNSKSRFLFYNGKIETNNTFKYTYWTTATQSVTVTQSWYPGFSNFIDFNNPSSDSILFASNDSTLKELSLYYNYWENEIETYIDKNSHILTLKVRLNSNLYSRIDFNDLYYFEIDGNGAYYTLLSIEGFDLSGNSLTTMKFLNYIDYRGSKPKRSRFIFSGGVSGVGDLPNPNFGGDFFSDGGGIIGGNNGIILRDDSLNGVYAGSDLVIGNNKNFFIIGDNIVVSDGLKDFYLFGGRNLNITTNNVVSFGGIGKTFSNPNVFLFNNYNPVLTKKNPYSISNPEEGMIAYAGATQGIMVWDGSNWIGGISGSSGSSGSSGTSGSDLINNWDYTQVGDADFGASNDWDTVMTVSPTASGWGIIAYQANISGGNDGGMNHYINYKLVIDGNDYNSGSIWVISGKKTQISGTWYAFFTSSVSLELQSTGFSKTLYSGSNMTVVKLKN